MYRHQEEAIELLSKWGKHSANGVKGGILAFKMGLGKTRTILEMFQRQMSEHLPNLVICAKSNLSVWSNEIKKFYPDTKYLILHNEFTKDSYKLPKEEIQKYSLIITTYEFVRSQLKIANPKCLKVKQNNWGDVLSETKRANTINYFIHDVVKGTEPREYTPIYSTKWGSIVADESQKFASINSRIYYAMVALKARSYYCLSGTPIVNYSTDLYTAFKFMGLICEKSDWNSEYYYDANLNERVISKDYSDTSIVLPKVNIETVLVELSQKEMKCYNFTMGKLIQSYSEFKKGNETFSAPLAMFIRLRQVCVDSQMIPEDFFGEMCSTSEIQSTKIDKAVEIIQTNLKNGNKIIVFSSFVKGLGNLSKALKSLKIKSLQLDGTVTGINRELLIKKFESSGVYNVFLSSYKTGGVGINLTCASVVILLEPWWNSSTEEQAISRSHRIGQEKPVTVYSLIAENTFETYLLQTQKKKMEIINEYFKGYVQKYRSFDSVVMKKLIEHIVYSKKATQDAVSKKEKKTE